jgi:hypothetical protein
MHRLFVPEPLKMQRYFRRPWLPRNPGVALNAARFAAAISPHCAAESGKAVQTKLAAA